MRIDEETGTRTTTQNERSRRKKSRGGDTGFSFAQSEYLRRGGIGANQLTVSRSSDWMVGAAFPTPSFLALVKASRKTVFEIFI
jgi:hypothetical protein